jgi:hypothetical protein
VEAPLVAEVLPSMVVEPVAPAKSSSPGVVEVEALAVFTAVLPINTMDNTVMTARHSIFILHQAYQLVVI